METERTEILDRLSDYGWRLAAIEENLEWWADEMWRLESVWSPAGSRAYITFLVDPLFEGNRKKGESVWGVMVSLDKPLSPLQDEREFAFSLGEGWPENLRVFWGQLSMMRVFHIE